MLLSFLTFEGRGCQIGERLFVKWVNRTWTNNQMNTCQITKRKLTKQPNKNLPNNQIVIKFFVCRVILQ